ncbi:MAG: hypothetical protein P1V36_01340 [Planctomycetota bacterium]|nr:hypothetical protein [Planctomycetota bacterium]
MQRVLMLLIVAALAGAAWWIAAGAGPGSGDDEATDEGLVVHVHVLDRAGQPVTPAQVVQVYDQTRAKVDAAGHARLTNVSLRADEAPSAEAFALALKPLARHHAQRRGYPPAVSQRADGSWDVRYALHAHGILRIHVEAVNLGTSKAFLERDEPLQRWEPVGGHAVVRPGSVVDFRIFEGWDAPGDDGKLAVRLAGEPDAEGIVGVATQRILVDAPSPGHTAQLKLVPEPVDPIAGVVRVAQGEQPPTLRGRMLVRQIQDDGSKLDLGEIPIDDEGSFVFRDAGTGRYELVAGLDFVPGLITTNAQGGDYLELETPGRARWVVLEHEGFDTRGTDARFFVTPTEAWSEAYPFATTIHDLTLDSWKARMYGQIGVDWQGPSSVGRPAMPPGWHEPPAIPGDGRTLIALPGPGDWRLEARGEGTSRRPPLHATTTVTLADDASELVHPVLLADAPHAPLTVHVDPKDWGDARSVTVRVGSRKRTVVRGGRMEATLTHVPTEDGFLPRRVRADWDDDRMAPWFAAAARTDDGALVALTARARRGGRLAIRLLGPRAAGMTFTLVASLTGGEPGMPAARLTRRGVAPVWVSDAALAPGDYKLGSLGLEAERAAPNGHRPLTMMAALADGGGRAWLSVAIKAGETTAVDFELPAK